MNIYVSNLGFNVKDESLKESFSVYGEVTSAKVITDKFTGQSRGFGFVEMSDDEAARKAITELDQSTLEGRAIKVTEARPKKTGRHAAIARSKTITAVLRRTAGNTNCILI